jgi:hypothetical protein
MLAIQVATALVAISPIAGIQGSGSPVASVTGVGSPSSGPGGGGIGEN